MKDRNLTDILSARSTIEKPISLVATLSRADISLPGSVVMPTLPVGQILHRPICCGRATIFRVVSSLLGRAIIRNYCVL
jgi:hypothetical protein